MGPCHPAPWAALLTAAEEDARPGPSTSGFTRRLRGAVGCACAVRVHGVLRACTGARAWCTARAQERMRGVRCACMVCVRTWPRASSACPGVRVGSAPGLRWQHVRMGEKGWRAGVTWPRALMLLERSADASGRSRERPGVATCAGQGRGRWPLRAGRGAGALGQGLQTSPPSPALLPAPGEASLRPDSVCGAGPVERARGLAAGLAPSHAAERRAGALGDPGHLFAHLIYKPSFTTRILRET